MPQLAPPASTRESTGRATSTSKRKPSGGWCACAAFGSLRSKTNALGSAAAKRTPQIADRLRNLDLTLASDRTLASWFEAHHAELETLTQELTAEREARRCRQLGLTRVQRSAGAVHVVIGGILRDGVGFLFSPEAPPPPINPHNYLWVEPLGDGWFLYRTD